MVTLPRRNGIQILGIDIIKIWFTYFKYVWESLGTRGFVHILEHQARPGDWSLSQDQPIKSGKALQFPSSNCENLHLVIRTSSTWCF